MIKRFATVAAAATILAVPAASSLAAVKPKPLGYIYSQCTTKTSCTYQASTDPKQKKISVSATQLCTTGAEALSQVGFVKVKGNGKFSASKTVSVESEARKTSVQVQLSGTLKAGKKATGSLKITTSDADCAGDSGVKKSFNMKYKGPFYGG